MQAKNVPIQIPAGVNPTPDSTEQSTPLWTAALHIRFFAGKLRKINGWVRASISNTTTLSGKCRTIFSYFYSAKDRYLLGTNQKFYEYVNQVLTNITPLLTSTTSAADSLNSNYATLANNPISTVSGSKTVTVNYSTLTDKQLHNGDSVTLSGATTTNNVPNTEINIAHIIANVNTSATTFTFTSTTAANATSSGGGASVVCKTALVGLTKAAHGMADGDRVKVSGVADFNGIQATEANAEQIIRYESVNKFSFGLATKATSAGTAAGGGSTVYSIEIADGNADVSPANGFGGGAYGAGVYGSGSPFNSGLSYPRIYSIARFGNDVVLTPGGQTGVYLYQSDNTTAPALLTNAPTAVNWVYESDLCVCTLGSGGVGNRVKNSAVGEATVWDASDPTTDAFEDDIEGAEDFISQINVLGTNLLFTRNQVWTHRFVGGATIWETHKLDSTDGLIGPMARISVGGKAYWMGQHDLYVTDGVSIEPLPNNTLKRFIFENINTLQAWKSWITVNRQWNEIEFHYPSNSSNEPDRIVRFNYVEGHFTPDTLTRTAGEGPIQLTENPLLVNDSSVLYRHESGKNDDTIAMSCYANTNYAQLGNGDSTMNITGLIPDSTQTGEIDLTLNTKLYPQSSTHRTFGPYTIDEDTEFLSFRANGRLRQYEIAQNALDADFVLGNWQESVSEGTSR